MTDRDDSRIIDRLERYANDALSPDRAQTSRMRDVVVVGFVRRPPATDAARRGSRPLARGWSFALALGLVVAASGVAAAESGPGQPFYGLRLAVASFTLPTHGAAREHGLAAQLDERLEEAGAAVRNGDGRAAQAALRAYLRTLAELERGNIDRAVLADLQHHLDVLQALISSAPSEATSGLQQAIDEAGHASGVVPTTAPSTPSQPSPPAHESTQPSHRP
jgi:hypothetical protein